MRSTKAAPRDTALAATVGAKTGQQIFLAIGCGVCHTPSITTAPAGTLFKGGSASFSELRTAPLWGIRLKARMMDDGESCTCSDSILHHTNEAQPVIQDYIDRSTTRKNQIITFLNTL